MKNMKFYYQFALILFITLFLSSCEVVGGIFKAGIWVGVIGVLLVVGLIFYLFTRTKR